MRVKDKRRWPSVVESISSAPGQRRIRPLGEALIAAVELAG